MRNLLKRRHTPALTVAALIALPAAMLCSLPLMATARAQTAKAAGADTAVVQDPAIVPASRMSVGWWAARHKQVLTEVASQPDTQLLMIGDSITNNYEKTAPANQDLHPIWEQYYAPRKALNLGFSGDTTANVLWRLDHGEVAGLHPKLAVVLIGTNNTAFGQSAEETEEGIDAVVKDVEHRLPETKILLMGLLPTRMRSKDANFDVNAYLGSHYAGGEDPMVSYIDISVVFYTHGELDTSLFYDPTLTPPLPATHPNNYGQRLMASAIEPAVARLMGDERVKPSEVPFRSVGQP
ncbi:MAG: GDSL-type esterase/lipase family protein [Acidobacteriaceae bacterium]